MPSLMSRLCNFRSSITTSISPVIWAWNGANPSPPSYYCQWFLISSESLFLYSEKMTQFKGSKPDLLKKHMHKQSGVDFSWNFHIHSLYGNVSNYFDLSWKNGAAIVVVGIFKLTYIYGGTWSLWPPYTQAFLEVETYNYLTIAISFNLFLF